MFNNGQSYVAAGGFNGSYNFGTQTGTMAVTNFDGRNFAASGSAPLNGANYSFGVTSPGATGTINGTFYGPMAAETGGSFAVKTTVGPACSVRRLDLGLVETTAGPRFNFPEPVSWVHAASLKPYLIANDVSLGGNQYFHTLGTGGEATAQVLGDVRLKSVFEFRQKNFNDAPDRPLSRGFTGSDKLVTFSVNKPITAVPGSELSLEFNFLDQQTRPLLNLFTGLTLPYFSNRTYAGAVGYRIHYDDPSGLFRLPLETNFFVSRSWAYYAAPDPCCGAVRFERHWRFGITQSFPLSQDVSMVAQVQRDIVSSLPLYNYTSTSFLVGPQIRF